MNYFSAERFNNLGILNIFSDASLRGQDNTTWTCGGALAFIGKDIIDKKFRIFSDKSSNVAELKAIRMGIELARAHMHEFSEINLFSDSQISIFGIRDRIYDWRIKKGELVGYANKPIKNQDIMIEIIYMVVNYDININFYHQKGHVNTNDLGSKAHALNTFAISNKINKKDIDMNFITYISNCNNSIDVYSRQQLYDLSISKKHILDPIRFHVPSTGTEYKELIQKFNKLTGGEQR